MAGGAAHELQHDVRLGGGVSSGDVHFQARAGKGLPDQRWISALAPSKSADHLTDTVLIRTARNCNLLKIESDTRERLCTLLQQTASSCKTN
jgi:hypothetical protein